MSPLLKGTLWDIFWRKKTILKSKLFLYKSDNGKVMSLFDFFFLEAIAFNLFIYLFIYYLVNFEKIWNCHNWFNE